MSLLQTLNQQWQPPHVVPNHQWQSRWHAGSTVASAPVRPEQTALTSAQVWLKGSVSDTLVFVCLLLLIQQLGGRQPPLQPYLPQPFWDALPPPCTAACELTWKEDSLSFLPPLPTSYSFTNSGSFCTKGSLYEGWSAICLSSRRFGDDW